MKDRILDVLKNAGRALRYEEIDSLLNFINNIYNEDLTNEISHNKKDE